MFGIFYLLANAIGLTIGGAKAAKDNYDAKQRGIEKQMQGRNRPGIYTDRKGVTRDIATGQQVSVDFLHYAEARGEDCYVRDKYGNPIRNLSEEIRLERFCEAIEKNDPDITVSLWKQGVYNNMAGEFGNPIWAGKEYKDLKTGDIYVKRRFVFPKEVVPAQGGCEYYMNTKDGMIVREADETRIMRKRGDRRCPSEENSMKFMEYFNEKQRTTGYYNNSLIPFELFFDEYGNETDFEKKKRLKDFYCNEFDTP